MNWDAIGAIAESLGVIGVIVTVVYVAVQIRHNSQAVQGATEQAGFQQAWQKIKHGYPNEFQHCLNAIMPEVSE